jgi:ABC-type transport system involved in Fe-S cluster assembly fused permease/ATPase subunit
LLFRFYDINGGRILIDGQAIASVTPGFLRAAIGIVPQDTVLFNDTSAIISPMVARARARTEIAAAAEGAAIHDFIDPAAGLRNRGRRARPEAVGRRETAGRDRADAAQGPPC